MIFQTMDMLENKSEPETIYTNVEETEMSNPCSDIYDEIFSNMTTKNSVSAGVSGRRKVVKFTDVTAVGLGFLCVLLLTIIIVLCIKHKAELHQMQNVNKNVTAEKDGLQRRYEILTIEKDQLQSRNEILNMEKDQLQHLNHNLTSEKNTLQSVNKALQRTLTRTGSCPYQWLKFMSSCYLMSSDRRSWDESRQECRRSGADLVIINSREEHQFISGFQRNFWIGLSDRDQEGHWKWVDNTALQPDQSYWMLNEPNNGGHLNIEEDCAEFASHTGFIRPITSTWNDVECSRALLALCEKKILCST